MMLVDGSDDDDEIQTAKQAKISSSVSSKRYHDDYHDQFE